MDQKEVIKMRRRVKTLHKQLAVLGPVMRGSVVIIGARYKQLLFVE
ncbi:MAG: hypothetical protein ACYTF1_18010 [Planctomycetota bacterium]|jgi:hypothetical protein